MSPSRWVGVSAWMLSCVRRVHLGSDAGALAVEMTWDTERDGRGAGGEGSGIVKT